MSLHLNLATSAASVNHGSTKTLFVEGEENSLDTEIISTLLHDTNIIVRPLQSSSALKSASKAFSKLESGYYFLIDRDHHSDECVNKSWEEFRAGTSNLLIWKKKELENYFLDPDFLLQSQFCKSDTTKEDIERFITTAANKRIFQQAANMTIIKIRETLQKNWIQTFKNTNGFETKEKALHKLLNRSEFLNQAEKSQSTLNEENIETTFNELITSLTDNEIPIVWGRGNWLDNISGKEILNELLSSNNLFSNRTDATTTTLDDRNRVIAIANDLVMRASNLPNDFNELKALILQLGAASSPSPSGT